MPVTVTELRANIYQLIDRVLETGEPLEIERRGRILRVLPPQGRDLERLLPPCEGVYTGDAQELVSLDWSDHWKPDPA